MKIPFNLLYAFRNYFSGNSAPRKIALLISMTVLFFLMAPLSWYASSWYEDILMNEQKANDTVQITLRANALTTAVNKRFALLDGLFAFAMANTSDEMLKKNFDAFASGLYLGAAGIRNFALAPGGVQRYIYPSLGNEATLGHDLLNDPRPEVRADVLRTIKNRNTAVSGPYKLRQGGFGLVARKALYVKDDFWGLVTMAVDMPPILEEARINKEPDNLEMALRGSAGKIFFGNGSIFENDPVKVRIELPEGYWELGSIPRGGWHKAVAKRLFVFQVSELLISILIAVIIYLMVSHDIDMRRRSEEQVERLSRFPSENPNPVMRISSRGVLEYANAASAPFLIMMGIGNDRTVNAEWLARIRDTLSNGRPVNNEFQTGDRTFSIDLVPIVARNYVNLYARDVTIRKRVEEELRANKAQLSNALVIAHLGHWEYDVANDLFTFNDQFYNIFRTTAAQVGGYTMHAAEYARRFVHPDDMHMVGEETRKAIETPDPHFNRQIEHRILYSDGTVGYVNVRFFIVKDSQGRTVRTFGVNQDITERKHSEKQLRDTLESLRKAVGTTIQVMVSAVETRDPYTSGHQNRVAELARAIATEMGWPPEKIEGLRLASSIHDIGKLSVPAEILSKPTKLSKIEISLIKEHARTGYEILKNVKSYWPLAEIVYQHHELMDGSGYPRNLKGEEILMEARILNVADVVEAMASHRPYRPGLGIDAALNEIEQNGGIFYDDAVVKACLRLFREKGYRLPEA
jgi:HD-GYP domain-containing protein (c-di-GMP phosphodiesterase class II)/sensor domain CHASE-containing protein